MLYRNFFTGLVTSLVVAGFVIMCASSVPGDPLYFLETAVLEPGVSVLARSDTARANVAIYRSEERLREAQQLAQNGEASPVAIAALAKAFATSGMDAARGIDALARSDAATSVRLHALFSASLSAHAVLLHAMLPEQPGPLLPQIAAVQNELSIVGTRASRAMLSVSLHSDMQAISVYTLRSAATAVQAAQHAATGRGLHGAAGQELQLAAAQDAVVAAKAKQAEGAAFDVFTLALRAWGQARTAEVLLDVR